MNDGYDVIPPSGIKEWDFNPTDKQWSKSFPTGSGVIVPQQQDGRSVFVWRFTNSMCAWEDQEPTLARAVREATLFAEQAIPPKEKT